MPSSISSLAHNTTYSSSRLLWASFSRCLLIIIIILLVSALTSASAKSLTSIPTANMVALAESTDPIVIPKLPSKIVADFIPYLAQNPTKPIAELIEPYKAFEGELRKVYAQQPKHEAVQDGKVNVVPVYAGHEKDLKIRARNLATETDEVKSKYLMPLSAEERRPDGSPATITSLKDFQTNFNLFSESSLSDLDWNNVVAAGSAVTTSLLPIPDKWNESKRKMREYYHEHLAPASDVDLFLYGLNEEEGLEKIKQIERNIKDSILSEVTTIRTKNAITIASQYPTRHVQIVLRLYDSISQILTGFDVDCACVAYDGKQVYAAPRALTAFVTQTNTIDLTRRSPSYENRLSKYSHRGFEVHWPLLDRSRIDPTIFERSFGRTQGLARLLILEKLPNSSDRDAYMDQRREERGRPSVSRGYRNQYRNSGNLKDNEEDEVAEWVDQEEVASYHTMTVPYGPKYSASKINRLLYAKDLLLNAEWNEHKDRDVYLHRHPCFFGTAEEVLTDCCGFCPVPKTDEEIKVAEEDNKNNVFGPLKFVMDDPGRQEIGSFNPITDDEWTTMAYVGDTARLCQAIVDNDLEHVEDWCSQEGVDINQRDYTGRTPLHLATMVSSTEIVKCLIDHGARMISRLQDGRTALHIAAARGNADMVKLLLDRSAANEEEEEKKEETRKAQRKADREAAVARGEDTQDQKVIAAKEDQDEDMDDESDEASEITLDSESEEGSDSMTQGSFVKIDSDKQAEQEAMLEDSDEDPDVFEVDVIAWDYGLSALHLAILNGHQHIIDLLVSEYGADILNPVKFVESGSSNPTGAILSLMLTLGLPSEKARAVVKQLLELGATSAQGDMNRITAFHYAVSEKNNDVLDVLLEQDRPVAMSVLNHLASTGNRYYSSYYNPLNTAIQNGDKEMVSKLLKLGAKTTIEFDDWVKIYVAENEYAKNQDPATVRQRYEDNVVQPVLLAAGKALGPIVDELIGHGADPKSLEKTAYSVLRSHDSNSYNLPQSLLDVVQQKLKQLRDYQDDNKVEKARPLELSEEKHYLKDFKEGTYAYWTAKNNFLAAKKNSEARLKTYEEEEAKPPADGIKEKREAIDKVIQELEHTEQTLIKAGAKSFTDMHPKAPNYNGHYHNNRYSYKPSPEVPYETSISFQTPDLNHVKSQGYTQLFEAAWKGDLQGIKELTLAQWNPRDLSNFKETSVLENVISGIKVLSHSATNETTLQAPLKVAIKDTNGFSPFSIAVLRGHYTVAQKIVEICLTQYHKDDGISSRKRWTMRSEDEDEDDEYYSEDDSEYDGRRGHDHLPIFAELVSDNFTIDNLGEVATMVKSDVLPLTMIEWNCKPDRLLPTPSKNTEDNSYSLLDYAVQVGNMKIFDFIMKLGAEQQALLAEDEDDPKCYNVDVNIFRDAITYGRTEMLGEMIKASGVGIPLNDLIKDSGVEIKTKPKYYQGLSVGGKKRADWAQAPGSTPHVIEETSPPLLTAAKNGNIDSIEWFSSGAPLRKYKEFAEANKHDKRIKTLESGKGVNKTIEKWLNSHSELILHAAVLAPHDEKKEEEIIKYRDLLKHLLENTPALLEQKSAAGYTPLHFAVVKDRAEAVKYLISKGANQRNRDKEGRNIVHTLLSWFGNGEDSVVKIKAYLELFDKEAIKQMLVERCSVAPGALTPLGLWLALRSGDSEYNKNDIVALLAEYSGGEELEMINGEGDLPLHVAVRKKYSNIASSLLTLNSTLLYRESATGRTSLEMARDAYIASLVSSPLKVATSNNWESYRPGQDDYYGITSKSPSDFVKKETRPSDAKTTWEICSKYDTELEKDGSAKKRRLVSLYEANEVAKRIAGGRGKKRAVVVNGGLVDAEVKRDFVAEWMADESSDLNLSKQAPREDAVGRNPRRARVWVEDTKAYGMVGIVPRIALAVVYCICALYLSPLFHRWVLAKARAKSGNQ